MRASYNWIRTYVPGWSGSAEEMAEKLTFSGTEVEEGEPHGDDVIFEIGVTSNRPDSLCHLGLAREVAALAGETSQEPECDAPHDGPLTSEATSVTVEDGHGCPRFTARVIDGVKVGPSPDWLVERIEALGMRAVNNVVDVTNFVLHELNQPLHAYDLDKLNESRLVVRRARKGEKLVAINGNTYDLGYNAQENVVHVRDLHATILHQLGIRAENFTYKFQGLDFRLLGVEEKAHVIKDILA